MSLPVSRRPIRNCTLCGTPNESGTTTCVTCGTVLPPYGAVDRARDSLFGADPASGLRGLLALPFFLVAALAASGLGVLPFVAIFLVLGGMPLLEGLVVWGVSSATALLVMLVAGGIGLLVRGPED